LVHEVGLEPTSA